MRMIAFSFDFLLTADHNFNLYYVTFIKRLLQNSINTQSRTLCNIPKTSFKNYITTNASLKIRPVEHFKSLTFYNRINLMK